jgi:hypothetical protein
MARIFCCGGLTKELSPEYVDRRMLYVPKDLKVGFGDFVEVKVGRSPNDGDGGRLNTVTRWLPSTGIYRQVAGGIPETPNSGSGFHTVSGCRKGAGSSKAEYLQRGLSRR